ncbi:MAG: hypothetical protein LBG80_20975 [Bacteroidales bacterium]|jgi:hypothetical protein|nr:hypothetical protein [Bacteroidales bacterium]
MKKLYIGGLIAITLIGIASVAIFYGCKKDETSKFYTEQDNVQIQKFDTNRYVDVARVIEQPYFRDFEKSCVSFMEVMVDLTQEDMNRLSELSELMKRAVEAGDLETFDKYYNEFMRIYYRRPDSNYGKENFEKFSNATITFHSKLTSQYPYFSQLNTAQQADVLTAIFVNINFQRSNTDKLPSALQSCLNSAAGWLAADLGIATASYSSALASCGFCVHPAAIGGCMVVATAAYGYAVYRAKSSYNDSVKLCHSKYGG